MLKMKPNDVLWAKKNMAKLWIFFRGKQTLTSAHAPLLHTFMGFCDCFTGTASELLPLMQVVVLVDRGASLLFSWSYNTVCLFLFDSYAV